jgi:hypothetical protein
MDRVGTREVGRDAVNVPPLPSFGHRNGQPQTCVECVLLRELSQEEEVKLAEEDGDVRIDDDVVVDLRIGV